MGSSFTRPLHTGDVNRLEQGRPIRVITKPFVYHVGDKESEDVVVIPAGFCSDGASVPWLLRSILEPWGVYAQAAIVHDFLYSTHARPRDEADDIFREAIKVIVSDTDDDADANSGTTSDYTRWGRFIALIAYLGVRIGGAGGYKRGYDNYLIRASRAKAKVKDRDNYLHNVIVENPDELATISKTLPLHLLMLNPNRGVVAIRV